MTSVAALTVLEASSCPSLSTRSGSGYNQLDSWLRGAFWGAAISICILFLIRRARRSLPLRARRLHSIKEWLD